MGRQSVLGAGMSHAIAYVNRPKGHCTWMLYCTCLNEGQPGRDTDPIFATGWIGGIEAHGAGVDCGKDHPHAATNGGQWTVREVDATHVEFSPSIDASSGGHFHTGNPTGPVEVRT